MINVKTIDALYLAPHPVDSKYNICSIYFRDDDNHNWLLYAGKVEKDVQIEQITETIHAYTFENPLVETNLIINIKPYKSTGLVFSVHDLEQSSDPALYKDIKAVLDKYKTLESL